MAQGGISASEKATSVSGGSELVSFQEPTAARPNDYKYKSLTVANKHRDGEPFGEGGSRATAFLPQSLKFSKA